MYRTSLDPSDPEMGNTKEFRQHFKNLLGSVRQAEVGLSHECMSVMGPNESLATIRASK